MEIIIISAAVFTTVFLITAAVFTLVFDALKKEIRRRLTGTDSL